MIRPPLLAVFLVVLYALPSFTALTTINHPLLEVAKHAPKRDEPPVCCLNPLSVQAPYEELLSFEEWKAKQLAASAGARTLQHSPSQAGTSADSAQEPTADLNTDNQVILETPQPRFKVPLHDRFNYASLDCSARVHAAHKDAQSPKSILSSQKDKYMLTPCSSPKKFVIVELCDDIRIDTIQLANFEFFSGVFQDFNVSVARTYTTDPEGWNYAGTYRANNTRGVQSFHPPASLRDFYRFIRIDFISHYGNEYYCPVSLLRVYGLTHLEEYKLGQREVERAKNTEEIPTVSVIKEQVNKPSSASRALKDAITLLSSSRTASQTNPQTHGPSSISSTHSEPTFASESAVKNNPKHPASSAIDIKTSIGDQDRDQPGHSPTSLVLSTSIDPLRLSSDTQDDTTSTVSDIPASMDTATPSSVLSVGDGSDNSGPAANMDVTGGSSVTHSGPSTSLPIVIASVASPIPMMGSGGESIYRTIMTRLAMLESNTSLYARYVEEQTQSIKEALLHLEEDLGRLQGISKAQSVVYHRTSQEWERYRKRLDREYGELLDRVNLLADEVLLEKRLGVAQLCLLLIVLIFMTLTRGSRLELLHHSIPSNGRRISLREWGRRNLSLSGSWVSRLRSRSPTPKLSKHGSSANTTAQKTKEQDKLSPERPFASPTPSQLKIPQSEQKAATSTIPFPRTPTSRHRPATPTSNLYARTRIVHPGSPRPPMRRANSQSSPAIIGPVPKSAKKWARSAHLHEITNRKIPRSVQSGESNEWSSKILPTKSRGGSDEFSWPMTNSDRDAQDRRITLKTVDVTGSPRTLPESASAQQEYHTKNGLWIGSTSTRTPGVDTDGDAWVDTDVEISDNEQSDEGLLPPAGGRRLPS